MSEPGYAPYKPQLIPIKWADNVWIVDGPEVSYKLVGMAIPCPTRMTVVRLADGTLWLHSPVIYSAALANALGQIGEIHAIVGPNSYHHVHINEWKSNLPNVKVYACSELLRRFGKSNNWLTIESAHEYWSNVFDHVVCDLGQFEEVVFFHRPSRTLIVTDLMQNFEAGRIRSPLIRFLLWAGGAIGPNGGTSIEIRLAGFNKRKKLRVQLRQITAWQPSSIILSHGLCYKTNVEAELQRAFAWVGAS